MRGPVIRPMVLGVSIAVGAVGMSAPVFAQAEDSAGSAITTIASGLTNPRGFALSPDGTLYLAQAGWGGDNQVAVMDGFTVHNGLTSSIATVADGCATPIVHGLTSMLWEEVGWIWGAADVAVLEGHAYALLGGAGAAWASPASFGGVYRLEGDGSLTLVANLSTWLRDNPPDEIPFDYMPDGSLFDLQAAGDALLLSESVGGQLIRITPDGEITTVADLSAGHPVPTGIAVDTEGNAFVGYLTAAPYPEGGAKVVKVTPDGTVSDEWTGLTAVTGVALGPDGTLYAAEMATGLSGTSEELPADSGRIVRQTGPDSLEPVVTDLPHPTAIAFDADGKLVISGPAFGPDAGVGQGWVVSVDPAQAPVSFAGFEPESTSC